MSTLLSLRDLWLSLWPRALGLWSKFTKLSEPRWCLSEPAAAQEGLTESFAMIRFADQAVVINLQMVAARGLQDYGLEILAHEIGHHVYCPADLTDHGRMIARMRWALPTKEHLAELVGNLYTDLLINDRLQRSAGLSVAQVYRRLGGETTDRLWTFYMRIYEILWSLPKGQLAAGQLEAELEGDAYLGSRLIRAYGKDWLNGAGRFAALCLPYLLPEDGQTLQKILQGWRDTRNAGAGGLPDGLTDIEDAEQAGAIHPALDPALSGLEPEELDGGDATAPPTETPATPASRGQAREPFEYGEILRSLGINLDSHAVAVRYYRERARPHLIRFPVREVPQSTEPLPEGLEPWDIGSPLEDADWVESVLVSPQVVPGLTTVQRVWGVTEGAAPKLEPLDLDLYVDCSGSMPNPQSAVSYLTLAGAIIALSALRVGASVQATLWSGARQFTTTAGFGRDEEKILQILTGYLGGATAFPIHILRETYAPRQPSDRPAHILVISDDGVTTMFDKDEQGNSGWDIARQALEKARGGGSLALNYARWDQDAALIRAYVEQNWQIYAVQTWDELIAFARDFAAKKYGPPGAKVPV